MTVERRRTAVPAAWRRRGGLPAALAATALMLGAASAAFGASGDAPSFSELRSQRKAPPGAVVYATPTGSFDNPGTNPKITDAVFSTTEYYNTHSIDEDSGLLAIGAKTDAELNALSLPPPSPFTVTVDVTMENDEGQTASGTLTYTTRYERTSTIPEPEEEPSFREAQSSKNAPPGILVAALAENIFDDAGTNPVLTEAVFSTTEYYDRHSINASTGILFIRAMTDAELNALASPPSSPFEVTVDVTMTNDEGQTASGTLTYSTTWTPPDAGPAPPADEDQSGGG